MARALVGEGRGRFREAVWLYGPFLIAEGGSGRARVDRVADGKPAGRVARSASHLGAEIPLRRWRTRPKRRATSPRSSGAAGKWGGCVGSCLRFRTPGPVRGWHLAGVSAEPCRTLLVQIPESADTGGNRLELLVFWLLISPSLAFTRGGKGCSVSLAGRRGAALHSSQSVHRSTGTPSRGGVASQPFVGCIPSWGESGFREASTCRRRVWLLRDPA
jgi:hypothetical protein